MTVNVAEERVSQRDIEIQKRERERERERGRESERYITKVLFANILINYFQIQLQIKH